MSRRKRRLVERLFAEEKLLELEYNRLILENLKAELKMRKRKERTARKIVARQNWKQYIA